MDRRKFIASSTAAVASATLAGSAFADHEEGHHHGHKSKVKSTLLNGVKRAIISSTEECIGTGRECLAHCARELSTGSSMMAQCNMAVQNMLAATEALNKIAQMNTLNNTAMKSFAKACREICEECHAACKKHENHHIECKSCMEACEKCIEACKKIV